MFKSYHINEKTILERRSRAPAAHERRDDNAHRCEHNDGVLLQICFYNSQQAESGYTPLRVCIILTYKLFILTVALKAKLRL